MLGPDNYLKVDGKTFPLKTPGARQPGLKLKINQDVSEGITYKLLMDFDASRSTVHTGNGKYILKPVIRTTLEAIGGSIKGFVTPSGFAMAVYAVKGTDTITGTYTINGSYMLRNLHAGTYSLAFDPANTAYKQQTKTNIPVTVNNTTIVDTVHLVK